MPGADERIPEIVVMELRDFWEARQAILALREWKIVILRLSELESKQMQRAVDLVTGSTYAINGYAKWIGEKTFLFTPEGIDITGIDN